MKRARGNAFGMIVAAVCLSAAAGAGEKSINGTVVDSKGQPQAGIEIAASWNVSEKDFQLTPAQKIESDKAGQFAGKVPAGDGPLVILAFDKTRTRGALRVVPLEDVEKPVRLELTPLVKTSLELAIGDFEKKPAKVRVQCYAEPMNVRFLTVETDAQKLALKLPVGSYSITADAPDAVAVSTQMDLDADEPDFDCGRLKIEPKPGKAGAKSRATPEFKITDAIGVDKSMKLSDYKGKWVVIDFWGYWCGPCVNIGLPSLFKFAKENQADSGKFVILTFHQGRSEKTLAECKAQFDRLNEKTWKFDKFPFPIVMDASGETVRNFKIQGYPTTVLIDPSGAIVETDVGAGRGICEARLLSELKKKAEDGKGAP